MHEQLRKALLERKSFGSGGRRIEGTGSAGSTVGVYINVSYTKSGSSWTIDTSSATHLTATVSSDGTFKISISDSLVITNFTFNDCDSNYDCLYTLDLSYIGDTTNVTNLTYGFSNLSGLTSVGGFDSFNNCKAISMEGLFRSCSSLEYVNLTGLNTSYMIQDTSVEISSRAGYPVIFYGCTSLNTVYLPKLPYQAYSGGSSSAFNNATNITSITATDTIENNLYVGNCNLTLESMKSILSKLSLTHTATCEFSSNSWALACGDSECLGYITAAKRAGWTLPDVVTILYYNDCTATTDFKLKTDSDWFEFGVESDASKTYYGKVWGTMYEPDSTSDYQYFYIDFPSEIDFSSGSVQLTIDACPFEEGLTRGSKCPATTNNNFMFFASLVDYAGNYGSVMTLPDTYYEETAGTNTVTFTSSYLSGLTSTRITGLRIDEVNSGSKKVRKKGWWFISIKVFEVVS